MNVTMIGFPLASPSPQTGGMDTGAAGGFAGMIGGALGQPTLAGATIAIGSASAADLAAQLPAQTNAPILPAADNALPKLPGDKPQVAMAQLLATATPAALVAAPIAVGSSPLGDAIAKALNQPAASTALTDVAGATPHSANGILEQALPKGPDAEVHVPATNVGDPLIDGKHPTGQPALAETPPAPTETMMPVVAQPGTADAAAVALDAPAQSQLEVPTLDRAKAPAKLTGKSGRNAASADAQQDAPATNAAGLESLVSPQPQTQPQPQPVAVAQTVQQPVPAAPPQPAPSGEITTKPARTAPSTAAVTAQNGPAVDISTDFARAIEGKADTHSGDAGHQGDQGAAFGQQLAADTSRTGPAASAATTTAAFSVAPTTTTAATHAPAAAAPSAAAGEPVIQARPGELGRSLGVEIARKVDAGEDTLRVRLNPAELGRVEVTLAFDREGRVQATMRAESQHTLDLLRQDAPDLGRALQQAGIRSDTQSFRFEGRDGGAGSGNGQSAFQQQSRGGNQQFRDEPEPQAPAYRPIRGDGQVDLIA